MAQFTLECLIQTDDKELLRTLVEGLNGILARSNQITVIHPARISEQTDVTVGYQILGTYSHAKVRENNNLCTIMGLERGNWFFETKEHAQQALINMQHIAANRMEYCSNVRIEATPVNVNTLLIPHEECGSSPTCRILPIHKGQLLALMGIVTPAGLAKCNDELILSIRSIGKSTLQRIDQEIAAKGWPARKK